MAYLSFDEINELGYERRSEPIGEYFLVMDIPAPALRRRVAIARKIKKAVIGYLKTIDEYLPVFGSGAFDIAQEYLKEGLKEAITSSGHEIDDYLTAYIIAAAQQINDVSRRRITPTVAENTAVEPVSETPKEKPKDKKNLVPYDLYFDSEDRAEFIAEDEANSIEGYEDFLAAFGRGFTTKTWQTMRDKRVRETHRAVQGKTVPIGEYFRVGMANLMFPRDTVNGADFPEELINCRCWLTFGG